VAVAAALSVALLGAVGCTTTEGATGVTTERQVRLYGTDGNMSNSFGDALKDTPGVLSGMKGTTPLTPLSEDFKRRMNGVDPNLADYNYAAESYDAVVVAGLAAETARTVDPAAVARQIIGVTTGGTVCESPATCLPLARTGKDFQYRGVSLRGGFTEVGEPSVAMYGTMNFGRNNHIDDAKTEFVAAGDNKAEAKTVAPAPPPSNKPARTTTPLKIGSLLPKTGGLAFQGAPMFAAIKLAIKELNEAGGVLGVPVAYEEGDDGTSPDVAGVTLDRFIAAGVHVVIGAAASGVSKAVMPKAVAAGRIMISPSATSDELSKIDDKGWFFRTSPPDVLQAKALADIIMRDGPRRVVVVAREDSYGTGLAQNVRADLTVAGITAANVRVIQYKAKDAFDPKTDVAGVFAPIAKTVKDFKPDAVLLVGFDESALLIRALLDEKVEIRP
jgi:ABC-type branched-subunit amino acid transport system substrate-binding protein